MKLHFTAAALVLLSIPLWAQGGLSLAQQWALAAGDIIPQRSNYGLETLELQHETPDSVRSMLSHDWNIKNQQEATAMLHWLATKGMSLEFRHLASLTPGERDALRQGQSKPLDLARLDLVDKYGAQFGDRGLVAWDESRRIFLARSYVAAGYSDEASAWAEMKDAAHILQSTYQSWNQMGDEYLVGRHFWNPTLDQMDTQASVRWLEDNPGSPWKKLPWTTPL